MPEFYDLRQISEQGNNAFRQGQAMTAQSQANALGQMQLQNAPQQMQRSNRLAELQLQQAEAAPQQAIDEERKKIVMTVGAGMAKKMALAKDDAERAEIYMQGSKGLNQFLTEHKLATPEQRAGVITPIEKLGGFQGFMSLYSGGSERSKLGRVVAGRDAQGNQVFFQADESGQANIVEGVKPPVSIPEQKFKFDQQIRDEKTTKGNRAAISKASTIINKVDEAFGQVGTFTAGFFGTILNKVGGTEASDLQSTLETVQANLGFEELRAMREASPTGGALGNITEKELDKLEATLSSLKQSQSPELLKKNLTEVKRTYEKIRGLLNGSLVIPDTQEEFDALPDGAMYVDPDDGLLYRK